MASGSIPRDSSIPKVLTVTADPSRPTTVTSADITAYQVGYMVYVYYTIVTTATFSGYTTISTISDARPRSGGSQAQNANVLFSSELGVLRPRMSSSGNNGLFQIIVSRAGTYAGAFVYVTDVAP